MFARRKSYEYFCPDIGGESRLIKMNTFKEAFKELTKKRLWYINSGRTPVQAKSDKYKFNKGCYVPEKHLRESFSLSRKR